MVKCSKIRQAFGMDVLFCRLQTVTCTVELDFADLEL